jgi:SAM-dependent methyltransferase
VTGTGTEAGYLFDQAWVTERRRLDAQGRLFNPGTFRLLADRGVREGWACLEVGGGTGVVATWLSDRVGPSGRVVATDIDTRFLDTLPPRANLEVRRHDIVAEPLEQGAYDLVHARLVLEHLPERERALRTMIDALKPGGWLLAEDFDFHTWGIDEPQTEINRRVGEAGERLFAMAGVDPYFGIKLPLVLEGAGLTDIDSEGRVFAVRSGSLHAEAGVLNLEQLKDKFVATGLLTAAEVDAQIELVGTPSAHVGYWPIMVAAWGRRAVDTG